MEKEQYWSVMRFLSFEGKLCSEIVKRWNAVYNDPFPSMAIVKILLDDFQRGGTSVFDEPHVSAPKSAATEYRFTKLNGLLLTDR